MVTGGGGSSSSHGSSVSAPWGHQQPYLQEIMKAAQGLFGGQIASGQPYAYGPGRVEGFSAPSEKAFSMIEGGQLGAGAQGLRGAASGELEKTLGGEYLSPNSNPYLQGAYDDAASGMQRNYFGALNSLGSSAAASGRAGGSSHAAGANVTDENFARGLGQLGNSMFGGAYESERGRMGQAAGMANQVAGSMSDEAYRGANALRTVGQEREGMGQRMRDEMVNRFNYEQQGGGMEQLLARYAALIGSPIMTNEQHSKSNQFNMNMGFGGV